jgi:hypothetical protein
MLALWFIRGFKDMVSEIKDHTNRLLRKGPALSKAAYGARNWLRQLLLRRAKLDDLNHFGFQVYSQHEEDGMLETLFAKIGTTNKFFVELGVENGEQCNTRFLREKLGWNGLLVDAVGENPALIKKEFVTKDNINDLFFKYSVPKEFDLLSIDIDGNDYWVWKELALRYLPRVVLIEYNAKIPPTESKTIAYAANFEWDGTDYFGASLLALAKLGERKGYTLVACERFGVNAFFVRHDIARQSFVKKEIAELYRPPRYGKEIDHFGWPASDRLMIDV